MLSAKVKSLIKTTPAEVIPLGITPMLASLVENPERGSDWSFEIKWDGYRALAFLEKSHVELRSRNDNSFTAKYPEIAESLSELNLNACFDGEIVVLNKNGISDFNALQNWGNKKTGFLAFYVFDLLWYKGKNLMPLAFSERRLILEEILPKDNDRVRLSKIFEESGEDLKGAACEMGLEGIIAKKKSSAYSPGKRSEYWLKIKCQKFQEVVICGFTLNEDSRSKFSSLILGLPDQGTYNFVGTVGTGFSAKHQEEISQILKPDKNCPFQNVPDLTKPSRFRRRTEKVLITWCKPEVVCEVSFLERSEDGHMRHSSFKGLRPDKLVKDVILEQADAIEEEVKPIEKATIKKTTSDLFIPGNVENEIITTDGHELKLTNLSKVFWPVEGYTKRDLVRYYHEVAPYMIPYLKDRIQNLHRYPNGISGERFYQKNLKDQIPKWIKTVDYLGDEGDEKQAIICNNEATLLYMANLGCIEINPFFNRIGSQNPDYSIIDLDPAENSFERVIEAAQVTHKILEAIEVPNFVKTSGSTGIHIYIPLGGKYTFDQSQMFSKLIVTLVNEEIPLFTTLERFKNARKGKMYLDFLQNRPGATVAGVYCVRPKPGATVSMPLLWDEVKTGLKMSDFTIFNTPDRLRETGDLFNGVLGPGINLSKAIKNMQQVFN